MKKTKKKSDEKTANTGRVTQEGETTGVVGKLVGQSAFTLYGCDLSTGVSHAEAAGLPPCRRRQ